MENLEIPAAVFGVLPVLAVVITWLVRKVPALAAFGPRNLAALVAFGLSIGLVVAARPVYVPTANVVELLGWILSIGTVVYKTAQVIFDLLTGQLASPDGHAERPAGV